LASNTHDNLLSVDPGFSNPAVGYYTLLPNSPAIDADDPYTNNERGQNGRIPLRADIGVFETEPMVDPGPAFGEVGGQVVMEAEHFTWGNQAWIGQTDLVGYAGSGYLSYLLDVDLQYETPDTLALIQAWNTPFTSPQPALTMRGCVDMHPMTQAIRFMWA
jgi:hypothetical protein